MKNKNVRGILALALVTALSFGVIVGSKSLAISMGTEQNAGTAADVKVQEELDIAGAEGIEKAVKTENGYMVTVRTVGYGGDIVLNVSFDEEAKNVTAVEVVEQSETEGVGSKITEAAFLSQFEGAAAPVFLPGMSLEATEDKTEKAPAVDVASLTLNDGTYEAKAADFDQNGFMDVMTMTVEGGKITSVVWDNIDADGNKKSVLSENGEYAMTEDGPTWKEQAEALAATLVNEQSMDSFAMNEQGKIDTVSGVSISVGGFAAMAENCLAQAAGEAVEATETETETETAETAAPQNGTEAAETAAPQNGTEAAETAAPQNGTQVEAVSGATISSTAAVTGINKAYEFLQAAK